MDKIDNFRDEYFFLSNFYSAPVTFDGITYQNNEAAFQAQKCINPSDKHAYAAVSPSVAKRMGRSEKLRPDWESVKVGLMSEIVMAKFSQNPDLAKKLLETQDAYLEEGNDWGDRIWGTVNGIGRNLLGQILMDARDKLREKEEIIEKDPYFSDENIIRHEEELEK